MIDAIGNCLELNNEFINRYCGADVAKLLLSIPEDEREHALEGCFGEAYFPGFPIDQQDEAIVLPHDEIEYQFEGQSEDVFENPDDFAINGNLAYLYTGYGLVIPIDCNRLSENVALALAE